MGKIASSQLRDSSTLHRKSGGAPLRMKVRFGMKILCIDIGTGTQDILLFDSSTQVEKELCALAQSRETV